MNEAELVFTQILNCDKAYLYLERDSYLPKERSTVISSVLKRRLNAEPLQYVLKKTEFMGFELKLRQGVFIPRHETEILVEAVIQNASMRPLLSSGLKILDLGTGSGCIAVSLAKMLPEAAVTATDISQQALEIARENALLHNLGGRIKFMQSDLFADIGLQTANYDYIVSNPPYVPSCEIENLQPEIQYEPRIALDGGRDGLNFSRRIVRDSVPFLKDGGFLIMEIGFNQKNDIINIIRESKNFEFTGCLRDYNSLDRVITAQKKRRYGKASY